MTRRIRLFRRLFYRAGTTPKKMKRIYVNSGAVIEAITGKQRVK